MTNYRRKLIEFKGSESAISIIDNTCQNASNNNTKKIYCPDFRCFLDLALLKIIYGNVILKLQIPVHCLFPGGDSLHCSVWASLRSTGPLWRKIWAQLQTSSMFDEETSTLTSTGCLFVTKPRTWEVSLANLNLDLRRV